MRSEYLKIILFLGLLLLIGNVLVLDYLILKNIFSSPSQSEISASNNESKSAKTDALACPLSCVEKIEQVTSSSGKKEEIKDSTKKDQAVNSSIASVKEYFIAFGSGSNSTDDWADVSGLSAYIDSTKYGQIKTVVFEASLHIPTGNQTSYVRLYDVTGKHPVWNSEMSIEGGAAKLLVSSPITLSSGSVLYQVQMKTQLKFPTNLSQARLHITTY